MFFVVSEAIENGQVPMMISTATIHDCNGTDFIEATAVVGVDLQQKGMQTPQAFGSASSYGKKYALGNLLLIDDTQDADATNSHGNKPVTKTAKEKPIIDVGSDAYNVSKEAEKLLKQL